MFSSEIFPSTPEFPLIHTRRYDVRAYRMSTDRFMLRGAVCDEKPAGLYVQDDPDPIWMHHMIVDLEIVYPTFQIEKAQVEFRNHPHSGCTMISDHYKKLEGMSISRGFNAKVRELFAGPRGCTHTTALLLAMAPVAIQTGWSMRVESGISGEAPTPEQLRQRYSMTINSCHLWAEEADMARSALSGEQIEPPLPITIRLRELGRNESEWLTRH